jgi:hypothetical protein
VTSRDGHEQLDERRFRDHARNATITVIGNDALRCTIPSRTVTPVHQSIIVLDGGDNAFISGHHRPSGPERPAPARPREGQCGSQSQWRVSAHHGHTPTLRRSINRTSSESGSLRCGTEVVLRHDLADPATCSARSPERPFRSLHQNSAIWCADAVCRSRYGGRSHLPRPCRSAPRQPPGRPLILCCAGLQRPEQAASFAVITLRVMI